MVKQNEISFFRVIGGKYKGKKLRLPSSELTRSSKSILRESLFNTLQDEIRGKVFIEVFGGSGSVGIEALSRGAKRSIFFELEKNAYETLRWNLKEIKCEDCEVIFGDVFVKMPQYLSTMKIEKNEAIFYFDPPFNIRSNQETIYEKSIELAIISSTKSPFLIIFEHITKEPMPESIGEYGLIKTKKFGKSSLSYYQKKSGI